MKFCCLNISTQGHFKCSKESKIPPHAMDHASVIQDLWRPGPSRSSPWGQRETCQDIASSEMFQESSWAPKQEHQPSLLSDQPGSTTGRNQVSSWIPGRFRWSYNHVPQCCGQPCLVPTSCSSNVQLHHEVFSSCVQLSLIPVPHSTWQLFLVGLNSRCHIQVCC